MWLAALLAIAAFFTLITFETMVPTVVLLFFAGLSMGISMLTRKTRR